MRISNSSPSPRRRCPGSRGGNAPPAKSVLASRPLTQARRPSMAIAEHPSVCTLDCPDTCSLTVGVEAGRIIKVRGSSALPYTAGVICNKVAHHTVDFVHGPGRLLHPLQRVGPRGSGEFRRIGWDEALATIAARTSDVIERYGPQAVLPL